jgi:hypothetical protein
MQLTTDKEIRLVRMFRCLDREEQEAMLVEMGTRLMSRYMVDTYHREFSTTGGATPTEEMAAEHGSEMEVHLLRAFPTTIHRRGIALNMLKDEDDFLRNSLSNTPSVVFGTSNEASTAAVMARQFVDEVLALGNNAVLPTDGDDDTVDMEEMYSAYTEAFHDFIHEWRDNVLTMIETQGAPAD